MSLSPQDLINLTCKSLLSNGLRSALTTFGVFMGVTAVNASLQVGAISQNIISKQLAQREAPQVNISIYSSEGRQPKLEDMEYTRRQLKNVKAISASDYIWFLNTARYRDEQSEPQMSAVTQDFLLTSGRKLLKGRFFSDADFSRYRRVIVIDKVLANRLFQGENPIGEMIILGASRPFIVVGLIESKLIEGQEAKGSLFIPMSIYSAMTGNQSINEISIRPRDENKMEELQEEARKLLEQRLPGAKDNIYVRSNIDDILEQKETLDLVSRGLTGVGMISLLISGVGIANITIAAVIERTSEIGLRRAIGATKLEIQLQFILEASILSLVGGIFAIATVHGLTLVVANTFTLPYQFDVKTAALSLGSALIVGVGACYFPAVRASQLDPVKALREA
ncbi:MAG: ABC transporter permease [Mastigocoleus sp. MO_167.B18]|uniref:ABC transporter permease n=1 Tax=Mastigocoleus sp. MO_188.B34 TaxID=3036635 RepID=UPI0026281FDB|nr:ABC transporter permease [Mastigocoleus sp. MO_188.B34]MDJ0696013.1 ABC transporter permease [Mastigocoleus sp. MO_188.B34]MDJ0772081.1 ABC transporter permease [Mastigocoleus sp. MO_167.B18]